ncbi:MAG: thiamine-phosphate kinase, partial [Gammaproteobacteria bacterium]
IGDDAAITKVPDGHQLVVSTDTLVNGVHFFENAEPYNVGFKSLAVNLSDMAAMGAEPLWLTLSLTLPESNPVWIKEFARGLFDLAEHYGVSLVGGDLSKGPLSVTIQIMGIVPDDQALKRCGAKPGDGIYVTGKPGMAALAVSILKGEIPGLDHPSAACLERLNRPLPRVETGIALREIASAAIDISDGLAADLGHLVQMSGVGAEIELAAIPLTDEIRQLDEKAQWSYVLAGGDDYELCFTVGARREAALERLGKVSGCAITRIGKIVAESGIRWLGPDGNAVAPGGTGYRHF